MMRPTEPFQSIGACAICGDRADGYHYGVLSCRGCNAFFRRAVAFNLNFHCRREGHCEINKNARCACRACRLHKCQAMGMDRAAVQVRREVKDVLALGQARRRNDEIGSNPGRQNGRSSTWALHSAPVFHAAASLDSSQFKSRLLGSSSSLDQSPQSTHTLDRLVEFYFCQRYRRGLMLCATVEQILASMGEQQQFGPPVGPAGPEEFRQVNKVQMVLMFEWAGQLEEFPSLEDPTDKTHFFRAFAPKYVLLDNVINSLEMGCTDRIVLPNGTFFARQQHNKATSIPQFSAASSTFWRNSQEEIKRAKAWEILYCEEHLGIIEELILPMAQMELSFGEFVALRNLLFWNPDDGERFAQPINEELSTRAMEQCVQDLQSWYELRQIELPNDRLESILALLPVIKKYSDRLSRIFALIPDFWVMPEWQFIGDLMSG